MIASLTGTVQYIGSDRVVIDVAGVGYEVFLSRDGLSRLPEKREEIFLHIHTNVREDAIVLFGFQEQSEKEMFLTLKAVSGIGPKLSLAILSGMQLGDLCQAIVTEDVRGLTTIPGVGKKTAERICVELKDKVGGFQAVASSAAAIPEKLMSAGSPAGDALSALINLGYPEHMARQALGRVKKQVGEEAFAEMKLEEFIREGLRALT
ncbi:MAG: Holliday junction branch migration protein RuvA [Proteobacteria bacterium]|nr:Holliday junction branch migration protein RuvA [Pseudomonadota bacterium]